MKDNTEKKRNICIVIKALPAGGAEKQALILAKHLSGFHCVSLVVFKNKIDKKFTKTISDNNINLTVLKGNSVFKLYQFYYFLKHNKVEIIFSFLLTGNVLGSVIGSIAGVRHRIGGIRNALLNPKKVLLEKFMHNNLNELTVFNNYCGAEFYSKKGFAKEKIRVIHNCIEIRNQHFKTSFSEKTNLLSVGRFVEQKDYFTAVEVVKKLVDSGYTNIHYTIVGYGELEEKIRDLILKYSLNEVVTMKINPEHIDLLYLEADIYLCTSIFEGLSNTLLEAMSFSLPIVATDVGDNKYLVEDNVNGFLADKRNANEIANSIKKLIDNPELTRAFGLNSYKKAKDKYSEKEFIANYLRLIEDLDYETHFQ